MWVHCNWPHDEKLLKGQVGAHQQPMETRVQFLTFQQLQRKLGNRGRSTIYRDVERGRLPKPTKIGSRLYWNEADVDAAIASLAG